MCTPWWHARHVRLAGYLSVGGNNRRRGVWLWIIDCLERIHRGERFKGLCLRESTTLITSVAVVPLTRECVVNDIIRGDEVRALVLIETIRHIVDNNGGFAMFQDEKDEKRRVFENESEANAYLGLNCGVATGREVGVNRPYSEDDVV